MTLNIWSVLLIASASQCLFLIFYFLSKPSQNQTATRLLITLLGIILLMNIGNFWYAARLYFEYPYLAGFARGFTLLIGPVVFLYTRSIVQPTFRLKLRDLLHSLGYFIAFLMILFQPGKASLDSNIQVVNTFLMNGLPATPIVMIRFGLYAIHLLTYLLLSLRVLKKAQQKMPATYQVSSQRRIKWLKKMNYFIGIILMIIVYGIINASITGYYNIYINYLLTLVYSLLVYTISFQSVKINQEINPNFKTKYQPAAKTLTQSKQIQEKIAHYLTQEKPYTQASFKQTDLANALNLPPHQLTAFLSQEMGTSYSQLINTYRIEEFIRLTQDSAYDHLSIFGKAQEVGFKSKSSFYEAFRKIKGCSPSEYLKAHF
ncbi:MAG TPA: hypothetical protein DCS93_36385 [Microscillaceae bacterium]|nr:hypothetical protein [Microscillaceae bacterium]